MLTDTPMSHSVVCTGGSASAPVKLLRISAAEFMNRILTSG